MKSCLLKIGIGFTILFGLLAWSVIGSESTKPKPRPPSNAKNVHFYARSGWQFLSYQYRFDAPVQLCDQFAVKLMRKQSFNGDKAVIERSEFTKFPINADFQPWFDVDTVKDGYLIAADDWIFAVVDRERERLYYYNSH